MNPSAGTMTRLRLTVGSPQKSDQIAAPVAADIEVPPAEAQARANGGRKTKTVTWRDRARPARHGKADPSHPPQAGPRRAGANGARDQWRARTRRPQLSWRRKRREAPSPEDDLPPPARRPRRSVLPSRRSDARRDAQAALGRLSASCCGHVGGKSQRAGAGAGRAAAEFGGQAAQRDSSQAPRRRDKLRHRGPPAAP
jgi:hypothetical protein